MFRTVTNTPCLAGAALALKLLKDSNDLDFVVGWVGLDYGSLLQTVCFSIIIIDGFWVGLGSGEKEEAKT